MKPSQQSFTGRHYQMFIVSINPQDNLSNTQIFQHEIDQSLQKFISNENSIPQIESLPLKSSRFYNSNFLKGQSKKFKSLKCSIRKNSDANESPQRQNHHQTSLSKKSDKMHQSFLRQSLQKNSLMNKILSQQRKANNFNHLKNSLFESLNSKQVLNSIHFKKDLQVQNEKMILLLSERPFPRKSSFGIPFGKLKMIKHLKQLQRRNTHLNQSRSSVNSRRKNSQRKQNNETSLSTLSQLKKVSLDSLQKSSIRNDQLKKIFKKIENSSSIQERNSLLKDYEKKKNKKNLLTISDDQNDVRSSLGVSIEMLTKKKVRTQPAQDIKSKNQIFHNNKLQKCQQKIINDLVKLQKIRNQKIVSNRGQIQHKNLKTNSLNNNQGKIFPNNDKMPQNSSKKSKYIIKFKTQPNQNPLQKLKTRISYEIKDDQFTNKHLIKDKFLQNHEVHGYSKTFQRKNPTEMNQTKCQKDKKIKLQAISHKINYLQKQLSGWDISKQTDIKQNWNLNIF